MIFKHSRVGNPLPQIAPWGSGIAMSRRTALRLAAVIAAGCASACLTGCAQQPTARANSNAEPHRATTFAFDTMIQLTVFGDQSLVDDALARISFFENTFSRTIEGSDVWRINAAQGAPVKVAAETADIIRRSLEYSQATEGLFDITVGCFSRLWDFKSGIVAADEDIQNALGHVGWQGIAVDEDTVQLADPLTAIDLGGIAKGYIADDIVKRLRDKGCESALIDLGGNIYALGHKPDGSPWQVGIQDPNNARGQVVATATEENASVVTSGLYERCFQHAGQTYHHILDPHTGYPAQTDLVSASIISDSSTDGDALATALFLMGSEKAQRYLENYQGLEGMLMDSAGKVELTSGCSLVLV